MVVINFWSMGLSLAEVALRPVRKGCSATWFVDSLAALLPAKMFARNLLPVLNQRSATRDLYRVKPESSRVVRLSLGGVFQARTLRKEY